jgi:ferric-dicitrate binding protein FerR (iron transport regulator)
MVKLERWYNVHITVGNKKLHEERITGAFENESIEQALEALKISVPFSYKISKNNITIN